MPQGQSAAVTTSAAYDASQANSAAEVQSVCLEAGAYDFIIYDVYGDGERKRIIFLDVQLRMHLLFHSLLWYLSFSRDML